MDDRPGNWPREPVSYAVPRVHFRNGADGEMSGTAAVSMPLRNPRAGYQKGGGFAQLETYLEGQSNGADLVNDFMSLYGSNTSSVVINDFVAAKGNAALQQQAVNELLYYSTGNKEDAVAAANVYLPLFFSTHTWKTVGPSWNSLSSTLKQSIAVEFLNAQPTPAFTTPQFRSHIQGMILKGANSSVTTEIEEAGLVAAGVLVVGFVLWMVAQRV